MKSTFQGSGFRGPLKWIEYGFGYIVNKMLTYPIFYLLKEDCSIDMNES